MSRISAFVIRIQNIDISSLHAVHGCCFLVLFIAQITIHVFWVVRMEKPASFIRTEVSFSVHLLIGRNVTLFE